MQNRFDLSSFAPAGEPEDEVMVESAPRKKEVRFDLSLFPESARPKVQPSVPESPYDDSALATIKRVGGGLVEYGAELPTGLHTTISAVNRLIGRPLERIAGAFDPKLEQELRAGEAQGFETARKIREGAKEFSEKTLGAKPGTPITVANLKKESFGGKIGMLARGTAESVPVTLVNLGITLLNPAVGTASIYLAETGGTRADLEELEKSGVKINPAYKDIAAVGGGALKTALEKTGLESLVSKVPGVRGKVFNTLSALLTEFKTEGVQELTDVLNEAGAKVSANDSAKVFETFKAEIENNLPRLEEAAIRGGLAGGAIRGGVEALRIPGERAQAKKEAQAKSLADTEEEARLAAEAKTTRENLQVQSERESLIERLQKERDLEVGGPLVGADETGFRRPEIIDQAIQKRLSEIPEEEIPRDPELRKLLDEKKLITQFKPSQFDLSDFKPAETSVEKPIVPISERQTRAQTPGIADAKSFNSALDDFLKIENETKGKPLSEQMSIAKQRLEEKGYHPAIVDELASPERLKRPDLEGDLVEATTREGRIKRAIEPPPELKSKVDQVAKRTIAFRDAEASYLQARKDIFAEVEKLGGKIIAQGDDGTFKIEIKKGKTKLSLQDQLALVKLRQEAAEAGAYSLATVGKGFEIAAAPLRIKQGETLKGDLNQKVPEFISRKNAFQNAKKGADAAKKALLDSYTDFYFKNKVEGKPNASLIGRIANTPVEVQLRRKASSPIPDTAVIDPTTGKTWAERLRDERKEAQQRSEALGPQGEPFVETRKIGEAKSQELQKEGVSIFDYKRSLSTEELASLDAAQARLDVASRELFSLGLRGQIAPTISPKVWKEYVEIGHLVTKGLARNLGEKAKITFENFKEAFKNAVGPDLFKRLESNLVHLWEQVKTLPEDWKSGDEVSEIVRAEAVENAPSPANVAKASRHFDFGLPLLDRLERSNPVGGAIGAKWRKAHGILKTALGRNAVEIRKIAKEAGVRRDETTPHLDVVSRQLGWEKKGANLILVDLINNPERTKDYPLTDVEKKIINLYRETYERNEKEIARLLGREPRPLKFQPTLNNEAREAIFVLKGGQLFEAMAKATAERSGLELKKVKQKFASGNLSGLDVPTHVPLKGNLVTIGSADAISALQAQNFEFARTLGLLRTFGPKWKNEIKNLREKYDQAGGDLEIFDLIEQGYRGLRPKDWISEKQSSRNLAARLYFRVIDPVFSALALSKSAYMQLTQPFIDLQNVGVKNYMNAIRDAFKGKLSADDLERMGIISRDILNWKFAEGEKIEDYGRMISGLTNRVDLMHAVSLLNDMASASNWRNFVNSLEGKKLKAKDKQTLRTNLGLTEAEIQKVEQGKFKDPLGENPSTPEEEFFVELVRRGKTQSQHTGKFGGEKSKFQTGSTSPFFLRFQNYTVGEFQRWRREIANLERALKSGDKAERNAAIGRVLKLIGTTAVQGELINIIRHTIKGEWDESEEGSAVGQALKGDYAQATKNFLWNFAEAGFMGAFTRAYFAYQIAQGSATALMDAFFPTNIVHQLWDAGFGRGRYADKDWSERGVEFLESRIPATDLSKPLERAMAITALAKEDHIAIDAARGHYFKWLEDTGRAGEIPEKSGYKESRASVARAYAALKRGDDEDVLEALATAFQSKLAEGTPKKKKLSQSEALAFVKKSLKARMLLSRHKRAELEELEKTIGEERYKRLAHHDALLKHLANSLSISKLRTQTKE